MKCERCDRAVASKYEMVFDEDSQSWKKKKVVTSKELCTNHLRTELGRELQETIEENIKFK